MSSHQASSSVSGVDSRRVVSGQEAAHLLASLIRQQPRHEGDRFERAVEGPLQHRVQPVTDTIRRSGQELGNVARKTGQGVGVITEASATVVINQGAEALVLGTEATKILSDTWAKLTLALNASVQRSCDKTLEQIDVAKGGALVLAQSAGQVPVVLGNLAGDTIEGSANTLAKGIDSTAWMGDTLLIKTVDGTEFVVENAAKMLDDVSSLVGGIWDLSRLLARKAGTVAGRVVHTSANVLADVLDGAGDVAERAGRQANEFGDEMADVVRASRRRSEES